MNIPHILSSRHYLRSSSEKKCEISFVSVIYKCYILSIYIAIDERHYLIVIYHVVDRHAITRETTSV